MKLGKSKTWFNVGVVRKMSKVAFIALHKEVLPHEDLSGIYDQINPKKENPVKSYKADKD